MVFNGIGPDMQHNDNNGLTPLMHAALGGHVDTVRALLDNGAHVNAEDEDRLRPLHFAAKAGSDATFTMLLEARADPCSRDVEGLTPIDHWAAEASGGNCHGISSGDIKAALLQGEHVIALHDGNRCALMQMPTKEDTVIEREEPPIMDLAPGVGSFADIADGPVWQAEEANASQPKGHVLRCSWRCHPRRPPVRFPGQNAEQDPELELTELPILLGSISLPCYSTPAK